MKTIKEAIELTFCRDKLSGTGKNMRNLMKIQLILLVILSKFKLWTIVFWSATSNKNISKNVCARVFMWVCVCARLLRFTTKYTNRFKMHRKMKTAYLYIQCLRGENIKPRPGSLRSFRFQRRFSAFFNYPQTSIHKSTSVNWMDQFAYKYNPFKKNYGR